jgi:HSP20 family molecular chaperone IbpA
VTLPGLSGEVEPKARLHHGVLEVRVPKPEQTRPRQIEIREEEPEASSGSASDRS